MSDFEKPQGQKTKECEALYAFLGAMYDSKLNGARMREAMLEALGTTPPPAPVLSDAEILRLRSEHGWAKETIRAIEQAIGRASRGAK